MFAVRSILTATPAVYALLSALTASPASGKAFLGDSPLSVGGSSINETRRAAAEAVLGCRAPERGRGGGGSATGAAADPAAHLATLEARLRPTWQTLPKNRHGRVEWRMLRYVAHRYFMNQSSLLVRGFEPVRQANEAAPRLLASADSPASELMLMGDGYESAIGYSLHDAASMVATIEQLIRDSEESLLRSSYSLKNKDPDATLEFEELADVMEAYLALWHLTNGEDVQRFRQVVSNRTLLKSILPNWHDVRHFGRGVLEGLRWSRHQKPRSGEGHTVLGGAFTFADTHDLVREIRQTFAFFWENQCQEIKGALVKLDPADSGRVPLSRFYRARREGEWRFGESEAYLRDLGILDESSTMLGPQIVIPNYVQGISNCIVSNSNYHVCCMNECDGVLNELESAVGAPVATPEDILRTLESQSTFDDDPVRIKAHLRRQLRKLADTYGGNVPLHGRLFAQWLHYVFPQECPFPHKAGAAQTSSIHEYGGVFATEAEVERHASTAEVQEAAAVQEERWMSQWSEEEELLADYSLHIGGAGQLGALAERIGAVIAIFFGALAAVSLFVVVAKDVSWSVVSGKGLDTLIPAQKAHLV